jgi:nondiscriminating aspartyl-tRNA synthetase
MKAVAEAVGEKCEFENVEVIKERFGLEVGGVPPVGPLLNLETFFDDRIRGMETVVFNCGLRTESIILSADGLIEIVQPKFGKFAKE